MKAAEQIISAMPPVTSRDLHMAHCRYSRHGVGGDNIACGHNSWYSHSLLQLTCCIGFQRTLTFVICSVVFPFVPNIVTVLL